LVACTVETDRGDGLKELLNKVYDIKIGKSPVRGAKDAKVTLVEFSDFRCPYSKSVQPLIETLLKAYPADLQAR
jgi:protein-disulfide isomerase